MGDLSQILEVDSLVLLKKYQKNFKEDSTILITGATGLIGINLLSFFRCLKFLYPNIKIYISNPSTTGAIFLKKVFQDDFFEVINIKLNDIQKYSNLSFDYIFHMATYGQPGKFVENDLETLQINSVALINLFAHLSEGGRFFFSSTSEIYSGNTQYPHTEEMVGNTSTWHPRACYIEAKRFGEAYCYREAQKGRKAYSGRISLSYGPGFRFDDQRVLNEFTINAVLKNQILMRDSGGAQRVYCYVRDTLDMILGLIFTSHYQPINIGGTEKISIFDLAKKISSQTNCTLLRGASSQTMVGSPDLVFSSIAALVDLLGKNDFVSIDDGLSASIKWVTTLKKVMAY